MSTSSLLLSQLAPDANAAPVRGDALHHLLKAIREHLGMDVAFLSEFTDGRRVFRVVDAGEPTPVQPGGSDPLEESYCQRVVDGRLPAIIPDAKANPESAAMPATHAVDVRAHIGVPVILSNGQVYGTFCCFSHHIDNTLNERDLGVMRVFAAMAARQVEDDAASLREVSEISARIDAVLAENALNIVYQPIYHIATRRLAGVEALSRFQAAPRRTPDRWFGEAARVGKDVQLESAAIRLALAGLPRLPGDVYLSLNASPDVVLSGAVARELEGVDLHRIVLEITEHALVDNYAGLDAALRPLREQGVRIAVDDAGAGYSSLRHILSLDPDIIKLDVSLTGGVDRDPSRRALVAAMTAFADETGMTLVAEGVESRSELDVLQRIGVPLAQGYLLGRPMAIDELLAVTSLWEH